MLTNPKFKIRDVLLSSGELVKEVVILTEDGKEIYESSPVGFTIGLKEAKNNTITNEKFKNIMNSLKTENLTQEEFDNLIKRKFGANISTPLSLAYVRYLSHKTGFKNQLLHKFISEKYNKATNNPKLICNILNGGKHAGNNLDVCEFMIVPKGDNICQDIKIASEIYLDLQHLIKTRLGLGHCMVGREGGFAPNISDVKFAISLIQTAIDTRNKSRCYIALDIAANNFALKQDNQFYYILNSQRYTTNELLKYYSALIREFPNINYLEDPFHEDDSQGWKKIMTLLGNQLLIVSDDLTASNYNYLLKNKGSYNASILKVNQIGTMTDLIKAYNFCVNNEIITIISQRSGETDSSFIAHLAKGLGSSYIKAGAPARERIIKYNELIRLSGDKNGL